MSRADVESVEIFKPASFASAQQAGGTNLRQSRRGREREEAPDGHEHRSLLDSEENAKQTQRALVDRRRPSLRGMQMFFIAGCNSSNGTANSSGRAKHKRQRPTKTYTASLNCGIGIGIGIPRRRLKAETSLEDNKFTVLRGVHSSNKLLPPTLDDIDFPVSAKIPDDVDAIRGC
ncbi:hypothetical protein BT96DRAFT_726818 [Gymnopus androsaceus JB14]|uniref:Uncharacterized protein n=1 Tax=Gymnopus androsaceus JB14 TaxID=1447944 RepID=A0A6A4GDZ2_9AGAR|nr:hypothetical protein BT96DRAFT_726818 [Gymnopus androsaceus JB14]